MISNIRRSLLASQKGSGELINGYVGNGLIEYFDAIDNQGIGNPRATGTGTSSDGKHWLNYQGVNRPTLYEYGINTWASDARLYKDWRMAMKWEYNFLAGLNSFTVEARFKQGNNTTPGCCFTIASGDTATSYIEISASPTVGYLYGPVTISKELPFPNAFNTLAVTYTNGIIKFYINGEFVGESSISDSAFANIVNAARKTVCGRQRYILGGGGSDHQMRDNAYAQRITVYDRALTATELKSNYQNDAIRFNT